MTLYPDLSSLNNTANTDATLLLVYCNTVTGGFFGWGVLFGFWMIIFLGSLFAQQRYSGRTKADISFAIASFLSFGLSVIMTSETGLLNGLAVVIMIALSLIGVAWIYFAHEQ